MNDIITGIITATAAVSSVTGGMVANPGDTIITGSSGASVQVTNVINSSSHSSGSSYTEVITSVDGQESREVRQHTLQPGESFHEVIATSSYRDGSKSEVYVETSVSAGSGVTTTDATTTTQTETTDDLHESITASVFNFTQSEPSSGIISFAREVYSWFRSIFGRWV